MRTFFLRNAHLTSCGNSGRGSGGIAYFCPACGEVWGRVGVGFLEWMAASVECEPCGFRLGKSSRINAAPGSFLKPLSWWTEPRSLAGQLNIADSRLLEYEARVHINWLLGAEFGEPLK